VVKVICEKVASPPRMDDIPYTLQWADPSPQNYPFPLGYLDPHLIYRERQTTLRR